MFKGKPRYQVDSEHLSKTLIWLLRHGALKENLPVQSDGFVPVKCILEHRRFRNQYTLQTIKQIVAEDNKNRYTLRQNPTTGDYEICANQGHTLNSVDPDKAMRVILNPSEVEIAVHGTYHKHWPSIVEKGLLRQERNHVHFATSDKWGDTISGFRSDCEILIYLDVRKAMLAGGMRLYRSANNVILCAGLNGCIPTKYFARAVDRKTGQQLDLPQ